MLSRILSPLPVSVAVALAPLALNPPAAGAQAAAPGLAPWTIAMRAMHNPLPVGQCTAIEIVVKDNTSGHPPLRPNGSQLDWQDFELSFYSDEPGAYAWGDERQKLLCARTATSFPARVLAHYPGRHLKPNERWDGISADQFVDVVVQTPPQVGQAPTAAGTYPSPGQPYVPPPTYPPAPQAIPSDPYAAQAAAPSAAPAPASGYPPPQATPVYAQPVATPAPPAQVAEPPVKDVGGLFKKLGKHMKKKAGEVKDQAVNSVATSATGVVDATAETGTSLVARTTAEASSVARGAVGGVGQSLLPTSLRMGPGSDNLASAIAAGHALLRMLRFTGNTDVLEPSGRQVVERLAGALRASPDTFVIEAHVDPLVSPAATQELSEHRAAAVKSALVGHGIPRSRLCALGYGASAPMAEIPPEGGPPSSARIELQSFPRLRSYSAGRLDLCLHQLR